MIPTLAISTTMSESAVMPAALELIGNLIHSIEIGNRVDSEHKSIPTHAGFGVRFEMNSIGGNDDDEGHVMDLSCRLDLLTVNLTSDPEIEIVHPTPAVHVQAELWKQDANNFQSYLCGHPEEDNRLRSIEVDASWNRNEWNGSVILNDASYLGHMNWDATIPGRIVLNQETILEGAVECLDAFLAKYSLEIDNPAVEAFFEGMHILGLMYKTTMSEIIPQSQDETLRWWVDGSALLTFVQDPQAYILDLMTNANGDVDFGKLLPRTNRAMFDHLAEASPWMTWIDDLDDPFDGHLNFKLPGLFKGYQINVNLGRYGDLSIGIVGIPLGPLDLSAFIQIPLLEPEVWAEHFNVELTLTADITSLGMFQGTSLTMGIQPTLTLDLDLPSLSTLPWINSNGLQWNANPSTSINLLDAYDIQSNLFPMIPGILLDNIMQLLVERLFLRKFSPHSPLATICIELDLAQRTSDGALVARSLFGIFVDARAHFREALYDGAVFDMETMMNLSHAILRLFPVDLVVEYEIPGDETSMITSVTMGLGVGEAIAFEVEISESPIAPGSLSFIIRTPSSLFGLPSLHASIEVILTMHPAGTFDLDGSQCTLTYDIGSVLPTNVANQTLADFIGIFATTTVTIRFGMLNNQVHLSFEVDFNPADATPPSVIQLLPSLSGVNAFLQHILADFVDNVLPIFITQVILSLTDIVYTENGTQHTVSSILIDLLTSIDFWDSNQIQMDNIKLCAGDVQSYFTQQRLRDLVLAIGGHLQHAIPETVNNFFTITYDAEHERYEVRLANATGDWYEPAVLCIGHTNSGCLAIWLMYEKNIMLDSDTGLSLVLETEVGACLPFAGHDFDPFVSLSAHTNYPIVQSPLPIQPALKFTIGGGNVVLDISTGLDGNYPMTGQECNAFWAKILPNSTPFIQDVRWGIPDLSALALGAANSALDFLSNLDVVQDVLNTPLYNGTIQILSDLTTLGYWLVHLKAYVWGSGDPPVSNETVDYTIRSIQDIVSDYSPTNQLKATDVLLQGTIEMVEFCIQRATAQSNKIKLFTYKRKPSESDSSGDDEDLFEISMTTELQGEYTLVGICIDVLQDTELQIGGLLLTIGISDDITTPIVPSDSGKTFVPGLNIQFMKYKINGLNLDVAPFLSIEIGYLSMLLTKIDRKPLLDAFLLLNAVRITTVIDMTFTEPDLSKRFVAGGRLDLDDFGISLGGDGKEDGGNGLAAGVLAGNGDGSGNVKPLFDFAIMKYNGYPVDFDVSGSIETWFVINKQFGPIKIAQIGVKITADGDNSSLKILVDGEAEIAGFLAQVDDLSVTIPILRPLNFNEWKYDMAGCALAYSGPAFKIAGALRREELDIPGSGTNEKYIEYQGLCTISTSTISISAIGAFGRIPSNDGSYVTCFVIAAIDYPLGGIPEFFVTGLAGGLGLNRDLVVPKVADVPNSIFMRTLSGFADDPMGALEQIRTELPAKRDSLWFAIGVKFTTYQVLETKGVLFVKLSDGFTIGILGLSSMSLPTKELGIGYVELAFLAYFDSHEQVLWVEAQLTDASYLFHKSCRLTGGFALVSWFKRGEFLLSLGGYHPKFKAPSYYPVVPRLGFSWKPMSKLTIKGGAYFTVCTSAVMLGGGFEATFKAGSLTASFKAGVDVLVVFDPFYYNFRVYIGLSVRYKTWLGTVKASLGADLEIEGPKMRGKARIEWYIISFTVSFGANSSRAFKAIGLPEFINKHVLQLPESEHSTTLSQKFTERQFTSQIPSGIVRPDNGEEADGSSSKPFVVEPEFELTHQHLFPAKFHLMMAGDNLNSLSNIDSAWRQNEPGFIDAIQLAPCGIEDGVEPTFSIRIIGMDGSSVQLKDGISFISHSSFFPETLWRCDLDANGRPKAMKSPSPKQPRFLSGSSSLFRAIAQPQKWLNTMRIKQIEKSQFVHNLPFRRYIEPSTGSKPQKENNRELELRKDLRIDEIERKHSKIMTPEDYLRLPELEAVQQFNSIQIERSARRTTASATTRTYPRTTNATTNVSSGANSKFTTIAPANMNVQTKNSNLNSLRQGSNGAGVMR
ncbi:MAG: hypothetical protein O3B67_01990 [archaeon]|nr:hypothetical protein [archaeon]